MPESGVTLHAVNMRHPDLSALRQAHQAIGLQRVSLQAGEPALQAVLETPSVGTAGQDAADDPAVWASANPVTIMGQSTPGFVAGTDKKSGLYIYGFDGQILQFLPEGLLPSILRRVRGKDA